MSVIRVCEECEIVFKDRKRQPGKGKYCSRECGFIARMRRSDEKYIGRKFGKLTILSRITAKRGPTYLCRCDCGKEVEYRVAHLVDGTTISCGCHRRNMGRLMASKNGLGQIKNIDVGTRFSRWVVLMSLGSDEKGCSLYECLCDCGEMRAVNRSSLVSGKSKSCGCYHREVSAENLRRSATTHGLSKERWYLNWQKRRRNKVDRLIWTREMETILFELQPACVVAIIGI